ncbi:MAG: tail fiber domain-containing protein, partial [Ferruginibacter sp.]
SNLVAVGDSALFNNGTNVFHDDIQALSNVAIGSKALYANATGSWNTAIGSNALKNNIGYINTIESNIPVEYEGGNGNTALGANALLTNTYGLYNTATGANALYANATGSYNVANGFEALKNNTTGTYNTALGVNALKANVGGGYNTALGFAALSTNNLGSNNTAIGISALNLNSTGSKNVAVGESALYSTNGTNNVAIGWNAGALLSSGSNNIFIGYDVQPNFSTAGSNQLNIGNWIRGYNGNIGIGVAVPTVKLDVQGNIKATAIQLTGGNVSFGYMLTSDGYGNATWTAPPATVNNYWTFSGGNIFNNTGINVGIGQSNPSAPLDVNGRTKTSSLQVTGGANNGYILSSDNSGNASWTDPAQIGKWTTGMFNTNDIYSSNIGNVGIGTTSPNQKLEVSGNVQANNFFQFSDARFKQNVRSIDNALANIEKLNGKRYEFNQAAFEDHHFDATTQLGLIAQDLEKVYPELVTTDKNGFKSVNYIGLIPVLIEGMKAQQEMIRQQQKQIDALLKK